jgi:2-polyprenyl-3-methyl-5-hydroxy-6-metoxy-1,4-benzoquinol methylase
MPAAGSGAQAQWLLEQGADIVAVDISPRMIEEAERRWTVDLSGAYAFEIKGPCTWMRVP